MSTLAVIPARGGSTRIPRKNIVDFAGRPLIAHILETARVSGLFEEIHVSTDDAEIAETVSTLGHPPAFMRDPALADDFVGVVPVLRWVHEHYAAKGCHFDTVTLLMATAPLLEPSDLRNGHAMYERLGGTKPILAVAPYPAPIEWAFRLGDDGLLAPLQPGMADIRSQDLTPVWYDSGTFGIFPSTSLSLPLVEKGSFAAFPIAPYKAIDIDDPDDLRFAEIVWRGMRSLAADGG